MNNQRREKKQIRRGRNAERQKYMINQIGREKEENKPKIKKTKKTRRKRK